MRTTSNSATGDVVAALHDLYHAARFDCDREGVDNRSADNDRMLRDGREAIAAVFELIEADRNYDRAKEQLRQIREAWAPDEVDSMAPAVLRFKEAEARRCAALARVGGAA